MKFRSVFLRESIPISHGKIVTLKCEESYIEVGVPGWFFAITFSISLYLAIENCGMDMKV